MLIHRSAFVTLAGAFAFSAAPLWAENVYDTHFGSARGQATGCFILEISPDDLAARPAAQVEYLSLSISPLSSDEDTVMSLQVKLKDDPYYYHIAAHCRKKGADQKCIAENGSAFRLSAADSATVRLTVLPKGLQLAGDRTVTISGKDGEDREFLIPSVPSEQCQ